MNAQVLAHFVIIRPGRRRPGFTPDEGRCRNTGRNPVKEKTRVARRSHYGRHLASRGHKYCRHAHEPQEPHSTHQLKIIAAQVIATRMCMCHSSTRKSACVISLLGSNSLMPILSRVRGGCQAPEFFHAGLAAARLGCLFGPHKGLLELAEPFAAVGQLRHAEMAVDALLLP